MATGMNVGAFRDGFMAAMDRLEQLERTPEGRAQLAVEYRAEAKRLRKTSGRDLHRQAGGERNTRVASPAELARRALERAGELERLASDLDLITGIHEPWSAYLRKS